MQAFFGVLGGLAILAEYFFFFISLATWCEPGHVSASNSGEMLRLTGAPGDIIRLKLPLRGVLDGDYSELSADLRTATAPEVRLPLNAKIDGPEDSDSKVLGTLVVPEFRHGTEATGRLYGRTQLPHGKSEELNVPLALYVHAPGDGITSGTKDMQRHRTRLIVGNVVLVSLGCLSICLTVSLESRALARAARDGPTLNLS
jgi:hypothetical protein